MALTKITIHGPNLSTSAQSKGEMHVHSADCQDNKHYGPGKKNGGDDNGWTLNVASKQEAGEAVYGDQIAEGSMTPEDALFDLHFAPCVADLPTEPPKEA